MNTDIAAEAAAEIRTWGGSWSVPSRPRIDKHPLQEKFKWIATILAISFLLCSCDDKGPWSREQLETAQKVKKCPECYPDDRPSIP